MEKAYLIHHGIKGQKWGVRRFQNKDGTLTAAGKERYGEDGEKRKKKHADETERERQLRIARNVAIGITATAAVLGGAYLANRYLSEHKDLVIKGGETMQRITTQQEGSNLYDNFYAAVGNHDKKRYKALLPAYHLANKESGKHLMKTLDLKVASPANAKKVYNELKKSDPSFNEMFDGYNYDQFNQNIVRYRNNTDERNQFNKFRDAMKNAGYAGVIDVNDKKYSGYGAKNPAIIFDSGKAAIQKMENINRLKVNDAEVVVELGKARAEAMFNDKAKVLSAIAATGVTAGVSAKKLNDEYDVNQYKRRKETTNE